MTAEELKSVKHHLIDFVSPAETHNVVDFRNAALPLVEELLDRGVMPVLCGGTTYYIESILWKTLVANKVSKNMLYKLILRTVCIVRNLQSKSDEEDGPDNSSKRVKVDESAKSISSDDDCVGHRHLWERLRSVDPDRAEELHPNDHRKINRSIQGAIPCRLVFF